MSVSCETRNTKPEISSGRRAGWWWWRWTDHCVVACSMSACLMLPSLTLWLLLFCSAFSFVPLMPFSNICWLHLQTDSLFIRKKHDWSKQKFVLFALLSCAHSFCFLINYFSKCKWLPSYFSITFHMKIESRIESRTSMGGKVMQKSENDERKELFVEIGITWDRISLSFICCSTFTHSLSSWKCTCILSLSFVLNIVTFSPGLHPVSPYFLRCCCIKFHQNLSLYLWCCLSAVLTDGRKEKKTALFPQTQATQQAESHFGKWFGKMGGFSFFHGLHVDMNVCLSPFCVPAVSFRTQSESGIFFQGILLSSPDSHRIIAMTTGMMIRFVMLLSPSYDSIKGFWSILSIRRRGTKRYETKRRDKNLKIPDWSSASDALSNPGNEWNVQEKCVFLPSDTRWRKHVMRGSECDVMWVLSMSDSSTRCTTQTRNRKGISSFWKKPQTTLSHPTLSSLLFLFPSTWSAVPSPSYTHLWIQIKKCLAFHHRHKKRWCNGRMGFVLPSETVSCRHTITSPSSLFLSLCLLFSSHSFRLSILWRKTVHKEVPKRGCNKKLLFSRLSFLLMPRVTTSDQILHQNERKEEEERKKVQEMWCKRGFTCISQAKCEKWKGLCVCLSHNRHTRSAETRGKKGV